MFRYYTIPIRFTANAEILSKSRHGAHITQCEIGASRFLMFFIWRFITRYCGVGCVSVQGVIIKRGKTVYAVALKAGAILIGNGAIKMLGNVRAYNVYSGD